MSMRKRFRIFEYTEYGLIQNQNYLHLNMAYHQIDCFKIHFTILKIIGIWPSDNSSRFYFYYSKIFLFLVVIIFLTLYTINFYFLPQQLAIIAEETIFYFMDLTVLSKVLAFIFMRDKIKEMLDMLESDTFQSNTTEEAAIIKRAKKDTILYWKITAGISVVANIANVFTPFITHLILHLELEYPVCRYSFIPKKYEASLLYPVYWYQSFCISSHMWYNVNLDTFLLGVMFLAIAQLDILASRLKRVTDICENTDPVYGIIDESVKDRNAVLEINKCIKHYDEVIKFCKLTEVAFSDTLFIQFSLGAAKICVCLFRFTLPATYQFLIFLSMYMIVMILQIMVPCWFGSQLIDRSSRIPFAVYDCDWTARSRRFKSNLRLLVERANRPLTISGGKMFLLSLKTFTSIINSAYSFFTLLRHMQSR